MFPRIVLTLTTLLLVAASTPAQGYFPLDSGITWELTGPPEQPDWTLIMGAESLWNGHLCHPRTELLGQQLAGTTYWSADQTGAILLHGLEAPPGGIGTWFFDPPVVYLDPELATGEQKTSTTDVYEVTPHGNQFYGEHTVVLTCVSRDAVTTPLGTFAAISVSTTWPDTPAPAPWRYASDAELAYGLGTGPVRIRQAGGLDPTWLLTGLSGLDVTAARPLPAPPALTAGPNPFNPATTLRFENPATGPVRLEVFDLAGRRVDVIRDQVLGAGTHTAAWRPHDLASGVYLARLRTMAGDATTRLLLLE